MRDGILSTIGHTPLILLKRLLPSAKFHLFAKLEAFNPGGSIKDRPALLILQDAFRSGEIGPETLVVESSSGNMGIGLAQACRYFGLRFVCVVDSRTSEQNLRVRRAYGAEIDLVTKPDPGLRRVPAGAAQPRSGNPAGERRRLLAQPVRQPQESGVPLPVDHVRGGCGAGGENRLSIRRHQHLRHDPGMRGVRLAPRPVAVDALGSQIFSTQQAKRMIPGLGAGLRPPLCELSLIDQFILTTDLDCVVGCRRLVAREAILAGGSSGAVIAAIERVQDQIPPGSNCVVILPDRGERYLETIYDDAWVLEHFGDVQHRWQGMGVNLGTEDDRLASKPKIQNVGQRGGGT